MPTTRRHHHPVYVGMTGTDPDLRSVPRRPASGCSRIRCEPGTRQKPTMSPASSRRPVRARAATVLGAVTGALLLGACAAPPMIDAHGHYTTADAAAFAPADIVAKLDAAGVRRLVVSGTPPELAQVLHRHAPDRFVPLLGVYTSALGKALWMHDAGLPERVRGQLADGRWAGLGELHLFARDAGNPVFAALVQLAAAQRLMLLIHGDAAVVDRVFELDPQARVLWAHLGTVPEPAAVEAVLERHAGRALWVDTSVRDERIAPGGRLLPAWRALFEGHPERFVVAVDAFSTQRWGRYGQVVDSVRTWLDTLPAPLARRLRHDNAAAMLSAAR